MAMRCALVSLSMCYLRHEHLILDSCIPNPCQFKSLDHAGCFFSFGIALLFILFLLVLV